MKKTIAALLVSICLSSAALAGEIPGSNPGGPPTCTGNCMRAEEEGTPTAPTLPAELPVSITDLVTGIFGLVF